MDSLIDVKTPQNLDNTAPMQPTEAPLAVENRAPMRPMGAPLEVEHRAPMRPMEPPLEVEEKLALRPVYKDDKDCRRHLLKLILDIASKRAAAESTHPTCLNDIKEDGLNLHRDMMSLSPENDEFLPQASNPIHSRHTPQGYPADPRNSPSTLHYVWCWGKLQFRFENYVGLLSAIKVLEPLKIVFHFRELPSIDGWYYNTWFQELRQSYPMLELRKADRDFKCGAESIVFGLEQLATSTSGGVFIGDRTILTHMPQQWKTMDYFSFFPEGGEHIDANEGIFFAKKAYPEDDLGKFTSALLENISPCLTQSDFDTRHPEINSPLSHGVLNTSACVVTRYDKHFFPKDIMAATTPTYKLAKWFYYGSDGVVEAVPDPVTEPLIPMIAHIFCLRRGPHVTEIDLPFNAYLGILSAIHVAGFHHVYIYGNMQPQGQWWDRLKGENITFVPLNVFDYVYQKPVWAAQHKTDIMRCTILLKYGGAYMDWDVAWSSRIPDSLRRYQMVGAMDWPRYGEFPEAFNLGVAMAKPGATFLKHFLESFRYVEEEKWLFNALLMSYRVYEQYPHTMYLGKKLQVICYDKICHPAWHENYIRDLEDHRPTDPFSLDEVQAFHFTWPDSPKGMEDYADIKNCDEKNMFCQLGRKIIRQSGRWHELDSV